ncbi:hypothetical protein B9L19_03545 [Geobacillus thermocatenulatus]|uniref:Uncharacterized protein n=1 Tax=Geobacillus thermocatenulatus TaxID=33938 RepID=A0A226QB95_9BACL|nr:hypothetical protein GT3921_04680 [Geobacillus thermocatenulatus]OXB89168.1 hypothetical protein B9L19_03545 [Geobacillus thermocatenulatus]
MLSKEQVGYLREEYLKVLDRLECLLRIGVKRGLYEPYNLNELKHQIKKLRNEQDIINFKNSEYYQELCDLLVLCGSVCCRFLIPPDSLLQIYFCHQCPIFRFEERLYQNE